MGICLNQRYDGDRDPRDGIMPNGRRVPFTEIQLFSKCTPRWYGSDFVHVVTNHSGFEFYDVDWPSPNPGIAAVALRPGGVVRRTSWSLKSCVHRDLGVTLVRTAPRAAAAVAYKVAPACVPGWVVLDDLKDLLSLMPEEERKETAGVITVGTQLAFSTLQNPEPYRQLRVLSQLERVEGSTSVQYFYRYSVVNQSERPLHYHVEGMFSPDYPDGFKGILEPGAEAEEQFAMDADDMHGEPAASDAVATLTDGCQTYRLGLTAIVPHAWVPGLTEADESEC